ncbi:MAG: DNA polymerase III subunit delta' [Lysobacterales bacterium]
MDARYPWHLETWSRFQSGLERGQVGHALLIHGEGGLHKQQLAREMAAALLCSQRAADATACGSCRSCVLYRAGNHPDWTLVAREESAYIRIDQIRALSERLAMRPQLAQTQVAMLWPAECMNEAAANALLKTLEEPAADTHLLLVADRIGRLPATIRSRCQRLPVRAPASAESVGFLARLAGVDTERAALAWSLSLDDPEAAAAMLQKDVWSEWSTLVERLLAVAKGAPPMALVASYARDGARLLERWSRLLGYAVRADGTSTAGAPWSAWSALTSRVEMSRLLPFATQLERSRAMLGSGVREDLMLGDLARRWSMLFTATEYRRGA